MPALDANTHQPSEALLARAYSARAMNRISATPAALGLATLCLTTWSCSDSAPEQVQQLARPVTSFALEQGAPPPGRLLPGVVSPYRQTQVPFQVTGRVEWLEDSGEDVFGEQVDRDGGVVAEGTVLARLETEPFERALNQSNQRLSAARLQLEALEVQRDEVLPAQLASARSRAAGAQLAVQNAREDVTATESAVDLARTTVERNRQLLPTGAVSDIAVRESESNLDAQLARLEQARTLVISRQREVDAANSSIAELEGNQALQEANIKVQEASIKELEEAVRVAEDNLEDTVLRAPFAGRITEIHVGEGSFVSAGSPVVTLTMLNPIQVEITVSAAVEEQLIAGTDALIYPMHSGELDVERAIRATLYQKRSVADEASRTFALDLIAANQRYADQTDSDLPAVPYLMPLFDNPMDLPGAAGGLYTLDEAVHLEGDRAWVLRVRGLAQGARNAGTLQGVLTADKIPVVVGDRSMRIASFSLVQVIAPGELAEGDLLVPNPTAAHAEGFRIADNRWLLRPGDLVQVSLEQDSLPPGFYVPVQAIRELNGRNFIFVIESDDTVRAVQVEVAESSGNLRRISSTELQVGAAVVSKGAHFLQEGDTVVRMGEEPGISQ